MATIPVVSLDIPILVTTNELNEAPFSPSCDVDRGTQRQFSLKSFETQFLCYMESTSFQGAFSLAREKAPGNEVDLECL